MAGLRRKARVYSAAEREAPREFLLDCFEAALEAVDARRCVREHLTVGDSRRSLQGDWHVIAIGKAAGAMTLGAIEALGERVVGGCVTTAAGHVPAELPSRAPHMLLLQGAHPLPDASSVAAGAELVHFVRELPAKARVLCLVSGGASSLVEFPVRGIALDDLQCVGRWALSGGAAIDAINSVRRQLSQIKGGGLANMLGERRVLALMISDVPGDDPRIIGSGLLHASPDAGHAPLAELPREIEAIVQRASNARSDKTLPRRKAIPTHIVASQRMAAAAAARLAQARGISVTVSRQRLRGEAAFLGAACANATTRMHGRTLRVWTGESTVTLPERPGRGGRNQHLALSAACALAASGRDDAWLLAAGTDGIDGVTGDAGAIVDSGTCARGADAGCDCQLSLTGADSGTFLEAAGDLLHTGATLTNVGDMVLGLRWRRGA
jgi:glycerate 2-kinase